VGRRLCQKKSSGKEECFGCDVLRRISFLPSDIYSLPDISFLQFSVISCTFLSFSHPKLRDLLFNKVQLVLLSYNSLYIISLQTHIKDFSHEKIKHEFEDNFNHFIYLFLSHLICEKTYIKTTYLFPLSSFHPNQNNRDKFRFFLYFLCNQTIYKLT
jgi:hypothetical protein